MERSTILTWKICIAPEARCDDELKGIQRTVLNKKADDALAWSASFLHVNLGLHDDGLVLVADAGADLADGVDDLAGFFQPVSYTHLTLPTKRIV